MKTPTTLLALCLTALACFPTQAQQPTKAPFAGFGETMLDRKKSGGLPVAPAANVGVPTGAPSSRGGAAATGGLRLPGNWDAPNGLSRGGPKQQRNELRPLLNGFAAASRDTGAYPGKRIYRQVTYLLPMAQAQAQLGLAGNLQAGGRTSVVGFPDGLLFAAFTPDSARRYEVRLLKDLAAQVVAVEFVANDPAALPPPPDPLPVTPEKKHTQVGRTYDFVPEGIASVPRSFTQVSWDVGDYVLISTRGGPKSADLYIPKPMVSLILFCLELTPGH